MGRQEQGKHRRSLLQRVEHEPTMPATAGTIRVEQVAAAGGGALRMEVEGGIE